tara:strand:+ start:84 stop:779 length:696 start_codon:yes stop_codon:yes gene_type:complete
MHQFIDKKKKLFFYFILFLLLSTQITKRYNYEKKYYVKLNNIEVLGLSKKDNAKVYKSLEPLLFSNIFFLNKNKFQTVLEKNNLIESFYIKKFYPNTIKVNIKKTDFLAITNLDNKKFYIGSNLKLIPIVDAENINKKLPFVFGKINNQNFIELKKIIDKSDFKFNEINSFFYFPSNRWDFKTNDGLLIKLPEKKILAALKYAHKIKSDKKFEKNKIIDLRIPNRIIISNE